MSATEKAREGKLRRELRQMGIKLKKNRRYGYITTEEVKSDHYTLSSLSEWTAQKKLWADEKSRSRLLEFKEIFSEIDDGDGLWCEVECEIVFERMRAELSDLGASEALTEKVIEHFGFARFELAWENLYLALTPRERAELKALAKARDEADEKRWEAERAAREAAPAEAAE